MARGWRARVELWADMEPQLDRAAAATANAVAPGSVRPFCGRLGRTCRHGMVTRVELGVVIHWAADQPLPDACRRAPPPAPSVAGSRRAVKPDAKRRHALPAGWTHRRIEHKRRSVGTIAAGCEDLRARGRAPSRRAAPLRELRRGHRPRSRRGPVLAMHPDGQQHQPRFAEHFHDRRQRRARTRGRVPQTLSALGVTRDRHDDGFDGVRVDLDLDGEDFGLDPVGVSKDVCH